MTAKDILNTYKLKVIEAWVDAKDESPNKLEVQEQDILALLQAEMEKVIGEDFKPNPTTYRGLTDDELEIVKRIRWFQATQRQRLREFIGTDNG